MNFEENIRKWVTIDNKLKEYAAHIKSLREQKNQLSNTIIAHAVDQNLSHNTVEITDGVLKFENIKIQKILLLTISNNFKFIFNFLFLLLLNKKKKNQI